MNATMVAFIMKFNQGKAHGVLSTSSALNACAGNTMARNVNERRCGNVIVPFLEDAPFPSVDILLGNVGQLGPRNLRHAEERTRNWAEDIISFLPNRAQATISKSSKPPYRRRPALRVKIRALCTGKIFGASSHNILLYITRRKATCSKQSSIDILKKVQPYTYGCFFLWCPFFRRGSQICPLYPGCILDASFRFSWQVQKPG